MIFLMTVDGGVATASVLELSLSLETSSPSQPLLLSAESDQVLAIQARLGRIYITVWRDGPRHVTRPKMMGSRIYIASGMAV